MKKITLFILALGLTMGVMAQKTNVTLSEMPAKVNTETHKANTYIYPFVTSCATIDSAKFIQVSYQGQFAGMATGQNMYDDVAYAQKYSLNSSVAVKGIAALLGNFVETPVSATKSAKLYSDNFAGELASKTFDVTTITESIMEFMFTSPISVQNFAVAIEVGSLEGQAAGTYNLMAIASTPFGCGSGNNSYSYSYTSETEQAWITMNSAYSTDCDLFIFPIIEGSGLNDVDINSLTYVYPNPAKDQVILASSFNMNKVEIFNMIGQKVYENTVNGITSTVNVAGFTPGTYMVKMYTEGGLATKKIVVE